MVVQRCEMQHGLLLHAGSPHEVGAAEIADGQTVETVH